MRLRIGARIFLGMVAVLFVSLLAAPVALNIIQTFGERELLQDMERAAQAFDAHIALRYELFADKAKALADLPHLKATLTLPELDSETARYAAEQVAQVSGVPLALLFDDRGNFIAATRPLPSGETIQVAPDVVASVGETGSHHSVWTVGGAAMLMCSVPITNGDAMIGLLSIGHPTDRSFAAGIQSATGTDVLIARGDEVLADTWNEGSTNAPETSKWWRAFRGAWRHPTAKAELARIATEERAVVVTRIPGSEIDVLLSRATAAVKAAHGSMFRSLALCLFTTILIALITSRLIARRIALPIRRITEATHQMAEQQTLIDVGSYGDDEIGVLARSVRTMATRILAQNAKEIKILAARERALEAANDLKNEFLANISHELRTPLHAVLSFAQIGRSRAATTTQEKIAGYFDQIDRSGQTLLHLVNGLLDIAKLEADDIGKSLEPTNTAVLVAEVVEELASIIERSGVQIQVDVPKQACLVAANANRLKQVIRNLLANAIRFTAPGTIIELRIWPVRNEVHCSVRDFGPGVPERELESIFDKFVQSTRTKNGSGGTGLGLAISRKIIAAHHGRIWAENHAEVGAVFTFALPALHGANSLQDSGEASGDLVAVGCAVNKQSSKIQSP